MSNYVTSIYIESMGTVIFAPILNANGPSSLLLSPGMVCSLGCIRVAHCSPVDSIPDIGLRRHSANLACVLGPTMFYATLDHMVTSAKSTQHVRQCCKIFN
jgi:hypothetical protein